MVTSSYKPILWQNIDLKYHEWMFFFEKKKQYFVFKIFKIFVLLMNP